MEKYGFSLAEEREMAEVGGRARLWLHAATGARLLSICNADENKCFGVSFATPPVNSTGVAHILEHSVLCGSRNYPVKEPFAELLKGSLQTFLNAFTFPDKTCYPVASANLSDFRNLVDVYLDAVFHPLLSEDIFRQEGWHVEAPQADGPWSFKGVVYNEMKGVYSSPESCLAEKSQQAMFPDNLYSLDSGGNPQDIPELTYAAFVDFHARYYHPGNAYFFFWGDDAEDWRLERIAREIAGYGRGEPAAPTALQKPFAAPTRQTVPFAAGPENDKALFTLNWLLPECGDPLAVMQMEMLEHILEGLPGSPLRRALIESGLGEDTAGCGLETDLRQMYYSTGLKGIAPGDVPAARELVFDTLRRLADDGIGRQAVEAAVNSVEFALREQNTGRMPRGLMAMIAALSSWLYGGDPLGPLAYEAPLAAVKKRLAAGERVFEELIEKHFLRNSSVAEVVLLPDAGLGAAREEAERGRLAAIREQAGPAGRQRLADETAELIRAQNTPDRPEDLAKIPALRIADMPEKPRELPCVAETDGDRTFVRHELPCAGIVYTNLLLPVRRLPERLLPLLPLFCRSMTEFGTRRADFSELGMRIAARTGGLAAAPLTGVRHGSREAFCYLSLFGKAVEDRVDSLFDLWREILLEPLEDRGVMAARLLQMAQEDKARMEFGLQSAGHLAVSSRIRARWTADGALQETLSGISQFAFLRELVGRLQTAPEEVVDDILELRRLLLSAEGAVFDCTADSAGLAAAEGCARALLGQLPARAGQHGLPVADHAVLSGARGEAWLCPAQVNYVGKGANLYDLGLKSSGVNSVIMRWLRMGRLWEEVRVRGGAYGVFCSLDNISGNFVCASYRDPNVDATISAYDGLGAYLAGFRPTGAQLNQAVVGAVGDADVYLLPDAKGARALGLWLSGITREMREQRRAEMLGATAADFNNFAGMLDAAARNGVICVLGGEKAKAAAAQHGWRQESL